MSQSPSKRVFRIVVVTLSLGVVGVLGFLGVVLIANRPPSPEAIAATLTAMPSPTPTVTPTPTPIPTLPGVNHDLLVCQREAGREMNAREMVGAVNISDDHVFLLSWFSLDWEIHDLQDALAGVIMGFDVALGVWERGCAVYDRVQIDVYHGVGDQQTHQLVVQAQMDDLLKWRAKELNDSELIARLQVTEPTRSP